MAQVVERKLNQTNQGRGRVDQRLDAKKRERKNNYAFVSNYRRKRFKGNL